MSILVTGPPGSGKTTLVRFAESRGDSGFVDADEIAGLCEWREKSTGKVLGLVTEQKETGQDDWYAKYSWFWRTEFLEKYLHDNPDIIVCGSSNNTVACYVYFEKIFILEKTKQELLANLTNPSRENPFGKTTVQRRNFFNFQQELLRGAELFNGTSVRGNEIDKVYADIMANLQ